MSAASAAPKVLVVNGPNLNLLGRREPGIYGSQTLDGLVATLQAEATALGLGFAHCQSNAEHELIEAIQRTDADFIIINPAAFTHTSVAIRDALLAVAIPFIEVHLSNIHAREPFRHHSYFSDQAVGVIAGLGAKGYSLALAAIAEQLLGGKK